MIDGPLPRAAVGHQLPLAQVPGDVASLLACLTSIVLDYVSRQKIGGTHMTFFYLKQLPVPPPSVFALEAPWSRVETTRDWIEGRVLELSFTAWDMAEFADSIGWDGAPFVWDEERRALLRAELDAAFFHLYGVERENVDYILDTFPIVKRREGQRFGEYRTKRLILEIYDAMTKAIETGHPYQTVLDPPPTQGQTHAKRKE
jgi:hypothetical protein